ncbi:sugar phosphate isomerase/epimerase [Catenuloplanes nepalensis]|uniref:Sugar phosphate isomerase/epimerase n=1 Tax=Catenuloplanes nepalensis TaxID=587533 RepID=A0ABT9MTI7_9ACTN|nr:sugar phosphate isomerase/epimerase family protein [Catenuloplanes nepalensis]MDP9794698.1 sugar phosphate isomerase/epimerase [Catenuloplanes nepalensis]
MRPHPNEAAGPSPHAHDATAADPGGVPGLRFGYGTNGFANHRLADALRVIADLGYQGVALTLDHDHLDPFAPDVARRTAEAADLLRELGLAVVIETGARYLLDPRRKHAPTLLHDDRALRLDFLRRAIAIGADLGAEAISFWAGVRPDGVPPDLAWERLVDGCAEAGAVAADAGIPLGFEPEPGMLVEDIAGWHRLRAELGAPPWFGLTLDIGHCRCLEPIGVADCVTAVAQHLVNVQIDDMRRGVHEHLEFGTGEIDFPPVLRALADGGYRGLVAVELPRHSHAAPTVAASSLAFLRAAANAPSFLGNVRRSAADHVGAPADEQAADPARSSAAGRAGEPADSPTDGGAAEPASSRAGGEASEPAAGRAGEPADSPTDGGAAEPVGSRPGGEAGQPADSPAGWGATAGRVS